MQNKIYTVAILGCGQRGAESYGALINEDKKRFKIVSLCEIDPFKLNKYKERFGVDDSNCFRNENDFFEKRRADVLLITTMDQDHVRQCVKALSLGYDILLEKPITSKKEECYELLDAQRKYGGKVIVCHVLRYAPAFIKVAELIDEGRLGKLVAIQALEQVNYWHQAHSYVRGNWRRIEDTAPMIIAKCCHDLDLLQYYARSKCKSVSSVGDLVFFKSENAPKGSAKRCLDCQFKDSCAYSAKRIYIDDWKKRGCSADIWPQTHLTSVYPLTEEALTDALKNGPYGRCVFACDNDAVDHQLTNVVFENGVKASLIMTAFTQNGGRIMTFFGTAGEIILDEEHQFIEIKPFGLPSEKVALVDLNEGGHAHGGGDAGIINSLYDMISGVADECTSLESSIESHLMGICAEESRLHDGQLIYLHTK